MSAIGPPHLPDRQERPPKINVCGLRSQKVTSSSSLVALLFSLWYVCYSATAGGGRETVTEDASYVDTGWIWFEMMFCPRSALRSATPWVEHSKIQGYYGLLDWSAIHMRECWALKVTECRIVLQLVALLLDIFLQWTTPFITISITSQPSKYEFITIFINTMLIWVSYLSSYFCFCHEVFWKRKFWIGLWSGVWNALQKYCSIIKS